MFISEDVKYVGVNDTTIDLFEGQYKVPDGISYNSYVILDEKTAVMDTVDINFSAIWLEKVKTELGDRKPDYLVVQHMEPDHSASIAEFLKFYPDTTVVGNAKTFTMIKGFFPDLTITNTLTVKEGDTLTLGSHVLSFVFAPMVHWPEVMVTYDARIRSCSLRTVSAGSAHLTASRRGMMRHADIISALWENTVRRCRRFSRRPLRLI